MSDKDRRRFRRYSVPRPRKIRLGNWMKVKDISVKGMGFETLRPPSVGTRYRVRISREDEVFEFIGRIVWARCATGGPRSLEAQAMIYRVGIEFETLLTHQLDGLLSLLEGGTHEVVGMHYHEEIDTESLCLPAAAG